MGKHRIGIETIALLAMLAILAVSPTSRVSAAENYQESDRLSEVAVAEEAPLVELAIAVEAALESLYPQEFGGLWIERTPELRLVVAMTSDHRDEVLKLVDGPTADLLDTRVVKYSLLELQRILDEFLAIDKAHSVSIDVMANAVVIDTAPSEDNRVANAAALNDPAITIREVPGPGGTTADIFGGLAITQCTSGFSVHSNQLGQDGMLTAGHCPDGQSYSGVNLPIFNSIYCCSTDMQMNTTPGFVDQPKFVSFGNGATQNVLAVKNWNQIVIGQTICKYGVTTFRTCGSVLTKTSAPSWIPSANPTWIEVLASCPNNMVQGGDSGGPVFAGGNVYGVVTGYNWHLCNPLLYKKKLVFGSIEWITNLEPGMFVKIFQ